MRTRTLFHFTSSIHILQAILKDQAFWPRFSLEDYTWITQGDPFHLAFPLVSFCDIPIARVTEHTDYYGKFGIGLARDWGVKNGINPLLYLNGDCKICDEIRDAIVAIMGDREPTTDLEKERQRKGLALLSYTKPIIGAQKRGGKIEKKDFYEESEWRFIPKNIYLHEDFMLDEEDFGKAQEVDKRNNWTRSESLLGFKPADIKYIFVENSKDLPRMVDYIYTELKHLNQAEAKTLYTRLIALDDLLPDL